MTEPLLCSICGEPLDDERAWQADISGGGAHFDCLEIVELDEED